MTPDYRFFSSADRGASRRWRTLGPVLALLLLTGAVYFSRLTVLPPRGEEPRRARVACEILERGDWIVPRQQGEIYLSRPPLGSWPIALLGKMRGEIDIVALRLPTAIATLLTVLLVFGYGRTFLSPLGAFAAAAAYATMGQVLELGRLAETESTFTLLVAGSLLLWHWGYSRAWSPAATWMAGYSLAALAALAKGPQGPVYFVGPALAFLAWKRDWCYLFSRAHLAGGGAFAVVLGAWQIPYYLAADWESVRGIWLNNAALRFTDNRWQRVLMHLVGYPLEIMVCMAPWSIWLIRFAEREFRRSLANYRDQIQFLAASLAVTFPTVWFATGARGRYYMPLYPLLAILAGLAIERSLSASASRRCLRAWNHFFTFAAVAMVAAAAAIVGATVTGARVLAPVAQEPWFAVTYAIACASLAALSLWCRRETAPGRGWLAVSGLSVFMGLTFTGALMNAQARSSEDAAPAVAEALKMLPPEAALTSLGPIDSLFAYHYGYQTGKTIGYAPWPSGVEASKIPGGYFCFSEDARTPVDLPFAFERLAVITLERYRTKNPRRTAVVARVTEASIHTSSRRGAEANQR